MQPIDQFADRWPRINALLDQALELPISEHEHWLETLDPDVAELREPLRELLRSHAKVATNQWLDDLPRLAEAAIDADADGPRPGDVIGPYVLASELGRGGMGAVWLANRVDGQLKRPVALKLPHIAWGGALAERLARERDILATLSHDHIARLYDAGVDGQGRPYLAMEYVEGQPIDVYCRERKLSVADRIGLLLQVAEAVAHAHSRLIVHRDLKPANILVTPEGEVRLLDFGIAKLIENDGTAETALTRLSGRALTLDYASPEQIRGEPLGTSSDVYSLGVVAYQLLAGACPYRLKRGTAGELEDAIATADVPLASSICVDPALKRQLRGDIDAILQHALRKHSADRYASIDAFAQDFKRHLEGKPVLAQPDRLGYRIAKFVGRYRLQVVAASFALLAVLAGAGVALWQAREARASAREARIESATAKAVQRFLESIFRANSGDQFDPNHGRDMSARQLLDVGADRIATELAEEPAVRIELLKTMASMYRDLDVHDRALELSRQRVEIARTTFGDHSAQYAEALIGSAGSLVDLDRPQDAEPLLDQAQAILDAHGADDADARLQLALTSAALYLRTDQAKGYEAANRALTLARARPVSTQLVAALQLLAENSTPLRKFGEAEAALTESIEIVEAHPELGANDEGTQLTLLGQAQAYQGRLAKAEATYRKAVEHERGRKASEFTTHIAEAQLGNFFYDYGNFREAVSITEPGYRWAQALPKARWGHDPSFMFMAHGRALIAYGHIEEGQQILEEADRLTDKSLSGLQMPTLVALMSALIDQGRFSEADVLLKRAEEVVRTEAYDQSPFLDNARPYFYAVSGRAPEALDEFRRWRTAHKLDIEPGPNDAPRYQLFAAVLHLAMGDAPAAAKSAQYTLARILKTPNVPYYGPEGARANLVLGQALLAMGEVREAVPVLEEAVARYRKVVDPEVGLLLSDALVMLARAETATGAHEGAAKALAESGRIRARHARIGPQHPAR
ncbi:hypothetical protein BH10PSE17_BH10PSE17_03110 [soil metagenome]